MFIGIDCGNDGALVAISNGELVCWQPMPLLSTMNLHTSDVDLRAITQFINALPSNSRVAIEVPSSIPNLNKSQNIFKQGANVQAVLDAVRYCTEPHNLYILGEREWQPKGAVKSLQLTATTMKDIYATLLPHEMKEKLTRANCRIPHRGAVDAYFMAIYLEKNYTKCKSVKGYTEGLYIKKKPVKSKLR